MFELKLRDWMELSGNDFKQGVCYKLLKVYQMGLVVKTNDEYGRAIYLCPRKNLDTVISFLRG